MATDIPSATLELQSQKTSVRTAIFFSSVGALIIQGHGFNPHPGWPRTQALITSIDLRYVRIRSQIRCRWGPGFEATSRPTHFSWFDSHRHSGCLLFSSILLFPALSPFHLLSVLTLFSLLFERYLTLLTLSRSRGMISVDWQGLPNWWRGHRSIASWRRKLGLKRISIYRDPSHIPYWANDYWQVL